MKKKNQKTKNRKEKEKTENRQKQHKEGKKLARTLLELSKPE